MSVLDRLRASVAIPSPNPGPGSSSTLGIATPWDAAELQRVVWSELVTDASALPITRSQVMSIPSYARGRDLICNTLARLSLVAVDAEGSEKSGSNSAAFVSQPDLRFSRFVFIQWLLDDLVFYGVAWLLITDRWALDQRPRAVQRVLPGTLQVQDGGKYTINGREVSPDDLIRIDGPSEGLLVRACTSVRHALALEAAAARFASNPMAAVELHQVDGQTLSPDQVSALIESWTRARSGDHAAVAYTPPSIEVRVHGTPVADLLTGGRNTQSVDAARFLGIPADIIDASPGQLSMTYANLSQRAQALIDFGLAPYAAAIESRLSLADITPAGTWIKFRFGELTEPSDSNPTTPAPSAGVMP